MATRLQTRRHGRPSLPRVPGSFGAPCPDLSDRLSPPKPEEAMAVPVRSCHRLGDLGQAAEGLAIPDETLLQEHDPLEPPLPFSHEQRAGLQTHALSRLRRPPLERSGGVVVLLRAKNPLDRLVDPAKSVRLEPVGQHPHQQPAWEVWGWSPPKWARQWRRSPLRSWPSRWATIDGTTSASSRGEASDSAVARRFAPCPALNRVEAMSITPLAVRPWLRPAGHGCRLHPFGLRRRLRHQERRARSGKLLLCVPFANHGIPSFAQSSDRRPRRVRQPSRNSVRSTMVAPSARRNRSITNASLLPSRGAAACVCRPTSSRLPLVFLSGSGCACAVSLAPIASSDPSSTAMAFRPVAVSLSA